MKRIINPRDFKTLEEVRLNRKGPKIGEIVNYKGRLYYLTYRESIHYFRIFNGFGVDKTIFWGMVMKDFGKAWQKRFMKSWNVEGIIIHYKGKKENRYYFADLDTWFLKSTPYGRAKMATEDIETYGEQIILNKKYMKIFGYDKTDHEIPMKVMI